MSCRELAEWRAYYELETVGDELAWKLNGHLAATLHNTNAWSRPGQPAEAEQCLWRRKPDPAEIHAVARRRGWREKVTDKLKALFPGLR